MTESQKKSREQRILSKNRKKIKLSIRPEAVLIKPCHGKSFVEVLRYIRYKVKPEEEGVSVQAMRRTQKEDVLIELGYETQGKERFVSKIESVVRDKESVKKLIPRLSVEIRDLDSVTTEEDVKETLRREYGEDSGEIEVSLTKSNKKEQRMAFAQMNESAIKKPLETPRIKIGCVSCRVRLRINAEGCFKVR